MRPIRLVTFDALHTVVAPRLPIYTQYAQVFRPYVGDLNPSAVKSAFKSALKNAQRAQPIYSSGYEAWWRDVIKSTAIGAGANPEAVKRALPEMTARLLHRFSSDEGYKLFDDALAAVHRLRALGVMTGLISNTDERMARVLESLQIKQHLNPFILSADPEVRAEKPDSRIFEHALTLAGVQADEAIHIGDSLEDDYLGAKRAGMEAFLVRRMGEEGEDESKEPDEDLTDVEVVHGLMEVVDFVEARNGGA